MLEAPHTLPIPRLRLSPDTTQHSRPGDLPGNRFRRRHLLAALLLVTVATCLAVKAALHLRETPRSVDRSKVTIATVERGHFLYDFLVMGQVVTAGGPTLYAPASGSVTLHVHAGDATAKNQLLAVIESPDLAAKLSQEEATLDSLRIDWRRSQLQAARKLSQLREAYSQAEVDQKTARRELDRSRKAFELGSYSELQALRAQDALEKAQFADSEAKLNYAAQPKENRFDIDSKKALFDRQQYLVQELRRQVAALHIRSSVNGKVSRVQVANGTTVIKDSPLLTVVDLSALEVEIKIPESAARFITLGIIADLESDGQHWKGSMSSISPEVVNGEIIVRVRFGDDKPDGPRQGQRVRVRLVLEQRDNVLLVNRGTFADHGESVLAYRVLGTVAERHPVHLGAVGVSKVEILEGVTAGEQLVVSGSEAFKGAARVYLIH